MIDAAKSTTTTLLLERLFDAGNANAWREFHDRYVPIIMSFARHMGFNETDAADLSQEALTQFVRDYRAGKYDRKRGRLRSWIIGIVKHRASDLLRTRGKQRELQGISAAMNLPDDDRLDEIWEAEHRQAILRRALAELSETARLGAKTLEAFELYVLKQRPVDAVAAELGITTHDVYMAKNRVAERLRAIVARWEALYDERVGCPDP